MALQRACNWRALKFWSFISATRFRQPSRWPCRRAPAAEQLTTVCASTPLMKMGRGRSPYCSMHSISCVMYGCSVMTCFRYSRIPTASKSCQELNIHHCTHSLSLLGSSSPYPITQLTTSCVKICMGH
jgi:hypothetical protein